MQLAQHQPVAIRRSHTLDGPRTMLQALYAKGLADPKVRSVKWHHAQQVKRNPGRYKYPSDSNFQHQLLIEAQGPLWTFNAPDCIGDGHQFSSRGLTDWYVGQFVKENHLCA